MRGPEKTAAIQLAPNTVAPVRRVRSTRFPHEILPLRKPVGAKKLSIEPQLVRGASRFNGGSIRRITNGESNRESTPITATTCRTSPPRRSGGGVVQFQPLSNRRIGPESSAVWRYILRGGIQKAFEVGLPWVWTDLPSYRPPLNTRIVRSSRLSSVTR